jgi:predicted Fe-S protein YdhL (DUF1289 family)
MRRGNKKTINCDVIETPCIKVCKLINRVCIGCFRTDYQIREWIIYTEKERTEIIKEIQLDRCRVLSNN